MQPATIIISQHFIQAFSWTLLHSLWQGMALALLTALLLTLARRSSSGLRYNLALTQFVIFVAAFAATFIWEWNNAPMPYIGPPVSVIRHADSVSWFSINAKNIRHIVNTCTAYFSANAPAIVLIWLILFVFRSVRMMGSLVYVHRAKRRHIFQPSDEWKHKLGLFCQKLQLKKAVKLLESGYVKMPVVIGNLKPVILVPVGLMTGLPAGQVEAILLHELAHIRRHDYMVNVLQTVTETVFFFNPGLLWISSLLRDERENCCDDIALAQTKNKKEFVQALISFKEHAMYGAGYQVAFPGRKNHLLNRVTRIIGNNSNSLGVAEKSFFALSLVVLSVVVAAAAVTRVHRQKQAEFVAARHVNHLTAKKTEQVAVNIHKIQKHASFANDARPQPIAKSPDVVEQKPIAISNAEHSADQAQRDAIQAKKDHTQATRDQAEAMHDQKQALADQVQAKIDEAQASKDKLSEENSEQQAHNEEQARLNEIQVKKNKEQDVRNAEQVKLNEIQTKKNREQEAKNAEQARLNEIQAKKNQEQEARNAEQSRLNEIQAKKNQEAAAKNTISVQQ